MNLPTSYSDVYFNVEVTEEQLPKFFYIVTAYNPQGENCASDENIAANKALENTLMALSVPWFRVLGGSKDMRHKESGFASTASLKAMLNIAVRYRQLAIYEIENDDLYLVSCDNGEKILLTKGFRARVLKFSDASLGSE